MSLANRQSIMAGPGTDWANIEKNLHGRLMDGYAVWRKYSCVFTIKDFGGGGVASHQILI